MAEPTGYAHAATLASEAEHAAAALAARFAGELREAREALARVRALHQANLDPHYCGDDECLICRLCQDEWPCETVRALDPPDGAS